MNKEEQEILDKKDIIASRSYCINNKTKNIKDHEDMVIKYGADEEILYFAIYVQNANINKIENEIIKRGDPSQIYAIAYYSDYYITKVNMNKLHDAIIKTDSKEYIFKFAKNVHWANLGLFKNIFENTKYQKDFEKIVLEKKIKKNI